MNQMMQSIMDAMGQGQMGQGFGLGQQLPMQMPQQAGGMGPMASILGGSGMSPEMMMRLGPALMQMSQQGQQGQQGQQPGALPIASAIGGPGMGMGMGGPLGLHSLMAATGGNTQRGYMAQGGGVAPQRIVGRG